MIRLLLLLWIVALCGVAAGVLSAAACLLGALIPETREVVTTRLFVLMTLWGTAVVFAVLLLPRI